MNRRLLSAFFAICLAAPAFSATDGADPVGVVLTAVELPGNAGLDLAVTIIDDGPEPFPPIYAVQVVLIEDSPEPFPTISGLSVVHEGDAVVVHALVGEAASGTLVLAVQFECAEPVIVAIDLASITDGPDSD